MYETQNECCLWCLLSLVMLLDDCSGGVGIGALRMRRPETFESRFRRVSGRVWGETMGEKRLVSSRGALARSRRGKISQQERARHTRASQNAEKYDFITHSTSSVIKTGFVFLIGPSIVYIIRRFRAQSAGILLCLLWYGAVPHTPQSTMSEMTK